MLVQDYQKITSNLTQVEEPYQRLPQIVFNTETRNSFLYTRAGLTGEYSNFARDDSIEGQRIDIDPYIKIERSEEHTSELQSLMRISYAVFCLKKQYTRR